MHRNSTTWTRSENSQRAANKLSCPRTTSTVRGTHACAHQGADGGLTTFFFSWRPCWALAALAIFPDLAAMVILSNEFKRQLLATIEEDPEIALSALGERIAKVFAFQVRPLNMARRDGAQRRGG